MKYDVRVEEVLSRTIAVEASSREEAQRKVSEAYRAEQIVLTADDIESRDISVC